MSECAPSNSTTILSFRATLIWSLTPVKEPLLFKNKLRELIGIFIVYLYIVSGLAKLDNKMIELELDDETPPAESQDEPTTYHLTGIVVHSGQASGGHYFSYILHK